jgi:hypothetical protein
MYVSRLICERNEFIPPNGQCHNPFDFGTEHVCLLPQSPSSVVQKSFKALYVPIRSIHRESPSPERFSSKCGVHELIVPQFMTYFELLQWLALSDRRMGGRGRGTKYISKVTSNGIVSKHHPSQ